MSSARQRQADNAAPAKRARAAASDDAPQPQDEAVVAHLAKKPAWGPDGYGDADDRAQLEQLSMVQREQRITERKDELRQWQLRLAQLQAEAPRPPKRGAGRSRSKSKARGELAELAGRAGEGARGDGDDPQVRAPALRGDHSLKRIFAAREAARPQDIGFFTVEEARNRPEDESWKLGWADGELGPPAPRPRGEEAKQAGTRVVRKRRGDRLVMKQCVAKQDGSGLEGLVVKACDRRQTSWGTEPWLAGTEILEVTVYVGPSGGVPAVEDRVLQRSTSDLWRMQELLAFAGCVCDVRLFVPAPAPKAATKRAAAGGAPAAKRPAAPRARAEPEVRGRLRPETEPEVSGRLRPAETETDYFGFGAAAPSAAGLGWESDKEEVDFAAAMGGPRALKTGAAAVEEEVDFTAAAPAGDWEASDDEPAKPAQAAKPAKSAPQGWESTDDEGPRERPAAPAAVTPVSDDPPRVYPESGTLGWSEPQEPWGGAGARRVRKSGKKTTRTKKKKAGKHWEDSDEEVVDDLSWAGESDDTYDDGEDGDASDADLQRGAHRYAGLVPRQPKAKGFQFGATGNRWRVKQANGEDMPDWQLTSPNLVDAPRKPQKARAAKRKKKPSSTPRAEWLVQREETEGSDASPRRAAPPDNLDARPETPAMSPLSPDLPVSLAPLAPGAALSEFVSAGMDDAEDVEQLYVKDDEERALDPKLHDSLVWLDFCEPTGIETQGGKGLPAVPIPRITEGPHKDKFDERCFQLFSTTSAIGTGVRVLAMSKSGPLGKHGCVPVDLATGLGGSVITKVNGIDIALGHSAEDLLQELQDAWDKLEVVGMSDAASRTLAEPPPKDTGLESAVKEEPTATKSAIEIALRMQALRRMLVRALKAPDPTFCIGSLVRVRTHDRIREEVEGEGEVDRPRFVLCEVRELTPCDEPYYVGQHAVHYTLTLQFGVHTQRGVRLDHVSDDQLTHEELQEFEEELAEAGAEKKVESMESEMHDLLARWDAGLDVDGGEQTVTDRLAATEEDKIHKRFCEAECEHDLDMAVMKQKFELGKPVGPEELAQLEEIRRAGDELVAIAARRVARYRAANPRTYGMLQVNKKNLARQIAADEFEIKFRRKQAKTANLALDPFVRVPCKPITLWGTPHTIEPKKQEAKEHADNVKAKEAEKKKQSSGPAVKREKPRPDVREAFVQARKSDRGDIKIPDLPPRGPAPTRNGVPTAASSTARRINLTQYREMMVRAK